MQSYALKHGDSFAVFDEAGTLRGLFHRDTRHLLRLDLTVDGAAPEVTGLWPSEDNTVLLSALKHAQGTLSRARFVWRDCLYERVHLRNFGPQARRITLDIAFAADFADLFEVRGHRRAHRGEDLPASIAADRVTLAYRGLDGRERTTCLTFDPPPVRFDASGARFELELAPRSTRSIFITIACTKQSPAAFFEALRAARRDLHDVMARATPRRTQPATASCRRW